MLDKNTNPFLKILSDFWIYFKVFHPKYATPYHDKILNKVLTCSDIDEGFIRYQCTSCGKDEKTIGFTCKHSFCLRCGGMKGMKFVEEVKAKMYSGINYRHLTLTMPEILWPIFLENNQTDELFNRLYGVAWDFINEVFRRMVKRKKIKRILAGAIMVIHVSGRKSTYNVHLHILLPMGVIDDISGRWVSIPFIPYELMRFLWQEYLLNMLKEFDPSDKMKNLAAEMEKKYTDGFVIHLDEKFLPRGGTGLAKYLAKYLFCPSISIRRIIDYNKKERTVDYVYNDHETHKMEREKVGVLEFIKRMIQQVMPENFQRVRYFGLHSTKNAVKNKKKIITGIQLAKGLKPNPKIKVNLIKAKQLTFQDKILEWRNKDPLKCKECGDQMELVQVWIKGKGFVFNLFDQMANAPPDLPKREKISKKEQSIEEFFEVQMDLCF